MEKIKMNRAIALFSCGFATICTGVGADIKQVLAAPKHYDKQDITVIGIARVPGDFLLFADVSGAVRLEDAKAVWVVQKPSGPGTFNLDRQWVRITGILDARDHGRGS